MHIRKIDTENRNDVCRFVRFPQLLYKSNPFFCPALESDARFMLDRSKHPFYRHSDADFFLAESEGQVLGRIAAVQNTQHNAFHQVKTAFFWGFDVVDDFTVAERLFEAVCNWARVRKRDTVLGPRGLTGSDAAGVLIEGYDLRAVMGVPYNYPYYDKFIASLGFEKLTDHLSGSLAASTPLPTRLLEIAAKIQARRNYRVVNFTSRNEMRAWVPRVLAVYEQAFAGTHEWHPVAKAELELMADGILSIADPQFIKLIEKDNQVIGFGFGFPDLSDGLRRSKGRLFPLGWLHLQLEFKRSNWLIANGEGMLPAYQNMGGNAVLYHAFWETIQKYRHFKNIEVVQVNETNFKSRSDMESLGVKWNKKHRSYFLKL